MRATAQDKKSLYGSALHARTDGMTISEQIKLGGRHDYRLTPDYFAFGGLGWHMITSPTTTCSAVSPTPTTKSFDPATIDGVVRTSYRYPSLLLNEESTHKLSDSTSAKQRPVLYPNLKNSGEYRATWDAGLAVAMSRTLSLNVRFSVSYNSDPGLGRKSTDTLLTTGVSMKFD